MKLHPKNFECEKIDTHQQNCFQWKHVLLKHKKKIITVLLMPWTLILGGALVAIEAIAHLFGCHLGLGGF